MSEQAVQEVEAKEKKAGVNVSEKLQAVLKTIE